MKLPGFSILVLSITRRLTPRVLFILLFSLSLLLPSASFAYDINRQSLYDYGPYYSADKKILGLTAAAQEPNPLPIPADTIIPTASFPLPGNPFYFVKGVFETLQTAVTFDPVADEEIRLRHATERLAEVNALVAEGNYTLANETAIRYSDTIAQINENITNLAGSGTDVSQFAANLEQTTIKQTVALEATIATIPPVAADSLRTALSAAESSVDTAADVLNKEAVPGELKDSLGDLKDQGILKGEIYDKLVNIDSRSGVRDELEKLNEAGVVPNLELKAIDAGQRNLYPDYYNARVENLKFAELKALEAVSPPTDPDEQKALEEFIRTYKSGDLVPNEFQKYLPYLRLAQLARTVKLDVLTPQQEEEVFRYYHVYLSENPTYKPEDFANITPVAIGAPAPGTPAPESTPSAQTPGSTPPAFATPSAAPYIGSPGFILPDSPFYFVKRFGETFGQVANFGTKSSLEYSLRLAETRLAEAKVLFDKGKNELALSAIKNYTNEIEDITRRLKELETSGVVIRIGDALDIAPSLEFNVTRANIVFERNLLPLPPDGADIFKEAIKSTQTAADVVADTLNRPAVPAVLIERIDNLKNLGFITPQEAEGLLQVDSRQELREQVEKLVENGTFPIADAKKLDDRQSQLYPDEFNKLVEVRKIEELQRLRAIQAEIAQTPTLRANADNYAKRIDELQKEVDLGLISADPIGQKLTLEYTKIATASAVNIEATPSAVPTTPLEIPEPSFAKPGDPWYFLKGGFEFVQTQIALTPTAKANVVLGIARERLAEAIALDSQGKKDKAAESYKEYVVELENLIKNVKGYNLSEEQGKVLGATITKEIATETLILERVSLGTDEHVGGTISTAVVAAKNALDTSADLKKEPPLPADIRNTLIDLPPDMIPQNEKDKILGVQTRADARAYVNDLFKKGIITESEYELINKELQVTDPAEYERLQNLKKVEEVLNLEELKTKAQEQAKNNEELTKKLAEFQANYKPGDPIPEDVRAYIPLTRLDELTKTIRPDLINLNDFATRRDLVLAIATLREEFKPTADDFAQIEKFRRDKPNAALPSNLARIEALAFRLGVRNAATACYLPSPPFAPNTPCPPPGAAISISSVYNLGAPELGGGGPRYGEGPKPVSPGVCPDGYHWMGDSGGWCMSNGGIYNTNYYTTTTYNQTSYPTGNTGYYYPPGNYNYGGPNYTPYSTYYSGNQGSGNCLSGYDFSPNLGCIQLEVIDNPSIYYNPYPNPYRDYGPGTGPKPTSPGVCPDGYHWMGDSGGWCMSNGGSYSSSPYPYTPPTYYGPGPGYYTTNPPSGTVPGSGPAPISPGVCPAGFHWMFDNGGWCMADGGTYTTASTVGDVSPNDGCPYGYDKDSSGNCVPNTYPGTSYNPGTSSNCGYGYYWNGSSCVATSTSGTSGSGSCGSGYVWNGSGCVPSFTTSSSPPQPPPGGCGSGYYWTGSACISSTPTNCLSNQFYEAGYGCITIGTTTPPSSTQVAGTCPSGYHWMYDNGGWCMADGGTTSTSPTPPPPSPTPPPSSTTGSCPEGYHWMGLNYSPSGDCMSNTDSSLIPAKY